MRWRGVRIFTVGHSTRTSAELLALLRAFEIEVLVDIRTIPRSAHNPQFRDTALKKALRARGLRYVHLAALGGLRRPRADSPNTAWRNTSFRGYADFMQTEAFAEGLRELRAAIGTSRAVLMCAEAVPWRCHRSLVADALTARGAKVEHLMGPEKASPHRLTRFAKVEGTKVTYPPGEGWLLTKGPFHLEATVRVLQRRPQNLVERWTGERYQRLLELPDGLRLVEVRNEGTIDQPDVRFDVLQGSPSPAIAETLRRALGLDVDPPPLRRLARIEPRLERVALALRGMRPPRFTGLFEAFGNVVPFQQVSLDAGVATVNRLVSRFGAGLKHEGEAFHAFPSADVIADARLSGLQKCGLSRTKAESLSGAARLVASGQLTEVELAAMPTEEALRRLCELRGIGPWSAALVLLRGLGRLEVFPPGDVGATAGLERLAGATPGEAQETLLRRFGRQRGLLYFYSLGRGLLDKGSITAAPPQK